MQSLVANKVATRSAVAARPARVGRDAVIVRASADSRRAVLSGILAGAAGICLADGAKAELLPRNAQPLTFSDDREAKAKGFDIIYEARDTDLPQSVRDGLAQARESLDVTKKRAKESVTRIDTAIEPSIRKQYWTEAKEELRRQIGTLRFDLTVLADTKPKEEKKKAFKLKKDFFLQVEDLDYAMTLKNQEKALAKLELVKGTLDDVLAAVS